MAKLNDLESQILSALLPFFISDNTAKNLSRNWNLIWVHFIIFLTLYLIFFIAAYFEQTIYLDEGIGIIQNPPFFAHLIAGMVSIPIFKYLIYKVSFLQRKDKFSVMKKFLKKLNQNLFKRALFFTLFTIGVIALASTVVLSGSYLKDGVQIYDSIQYPFSFSSYFVIRVYLYLFCYPLLIASTLVIISFLFISLKESKEPFIPFHLDKMGGLRKYFEAVDKPVYAIQSITVFIALMNYIGWGGMELVPLIMFSILPSLVTILALLLFGFFNEILNTKRKKVIEVIREKQMKWFKEIELSGQEDLNYVKLIEEIEATERLLEILNKRYNPKILKYFLNLLTLLIPKLVNMAIG